MAEELLAAIGEKRSEIYEQVGASLSQGQSEAA